MQATDLRFLVSSQVVSMKVSSSEFPAALSIGEYVTAPCSKPKNGILSSFEVLDYSLSQFSVSSSWIGKELGKN